jgi:hypothetical protein
VGRAMLDLPGVIGAGLPQAEPGEQAVRTFAARDRVPPLLGERAGVRADAILTVSTEREAERFRFHRIVLCCRFLLWPDAVRESFPASAFTCFQRKWAAEMTKNSREAWSVIRDA